MKKDKSQNLHSIYFCMNPESHGGTWGKSLLPLQIDTEYI